MLEKLRWQTNVDINVFNLYWMVLTLIQIKITFTTVTVYTWQSLVGLGLTKNVLYCKNTGSHWGKACNQAQPIRKNLGGIGCAVKNVLAFFKYNIYRKVASIRLRISVSSTFKDFHTVYEGEIWMLIYCDLWPKEFNIE